ncbi:CDP-glycerol glycerophosphotransferase family protein [Prevotella sp. 10(H)]|uniref:CDP-glycerol glycerophosphotransferase family protein n=1 Tax=Prevotella sp. 10(H) TaxID=1158294 RepID=UPI0004A73CA3|nr:CDP-glycerol glycerophosphotransferase family protein [Prevotella sp. 10(H)]
MKRYLFFVSLSYSYTILRPLQDEIWRRGSDVAWYIENSAPVCLHKGEKHLKTIKEVMEYNPIAVFVPGVRVYDFFPGVKVEVFHGLYYKRGDYGDHYKIRGFFDIYCTTSPMFTPRFKELEKKYGFFKVYETGWSKFDGWLPVNNEKTPNEKPVIIFAPTFTKGIESASVLHGKIEDLIKDRDWIWLFSFHPKMDKEILDRYKELAEKYDNATFCETEDKAELFRQSDVMLSDNSSVIYEFLWFNKPAVTYKNAFPDNHLINIDNPEQLEQAIDKALQHPEDLMENIRIFMNQVHPFRDGKSSARILDAVDDFITNYKGKLKKKPLILYRKLKLRKKTGYYPFGPRYKNK